MVARLQPRRIVGRQAGIRAVRYISYIDRGYGLAGWLRRLGPARPGQHTQPEQPEAPFSDKLKKENVCHGGRSKAAALSGPLRAGH